MKANQVMRLVKQYILPHLPGFQIKRSSYLYATPVEMILRGFYFQTSYLDRTAFTVWVFVQPLYIPKEHVVLNIGGRLGWLKKDEDIWWQWSPDEPEHEEPTLLNVLEFIQEVGLPFLEQLQTPADLIRRGAKISGVPKNCYGQEVIAYSYILTGDYRKAKQLLARLYRELRRDEKDYLWMGEMADRAELLLETLDRDHREAVRLLHEWRDSTLRNLHLEKVIAPKTAP